MPIAGQVVLVTGAARGMGREYVRAFLKEGAKVIATDASWTPSGVSSDDVDFRKELDGNPDVLVERMDITIDSHIKRVFETAMDRFGTVDVMINNAGLRAARPLSASGKPSDHRDGELGDWWRMFDTHVFGTFRVIKTFVQPMIAPEARQHHQRLLGRRWWKDAGGAVSAGQSRRGHDDDLPGGRAQAPEHRGQRAAPRLHAYYRHRRTDCRPR